MFRRILLLAVGLFPLSSQPLAAAQPDPAIHVVFVPGATGDPFYATLESGIVQGFADSNAEVDFATRSPGQFEVEIQIALIEEIIAQASTDYLFVAPTDRQLLIPVLEQAHHAGIEVITVDTFIGDGDYSSGSVTFPITHIGSDNFTSGFTACQVLAGELDEGASIYIQHTGSGISTVDQRQAGCEAAAYAYGLEVVAVDYNADDARLALEQTTAALKEYPDLAGIFGTNYFGAYGAGLAVQQAGLHGQIKTVAIDATTSAVNLLRDGIITDIIAQKPFEMGYWAANLAVAHARGYESIPRRFPIDNVLINAENLDAPGIRNYIYSPTLHRPQPALTDLTIALVPGVDRDPPDQFT